MRLSFAERLRVDRRGGSTIEFTLLAAPFMLLLAAAIEFSLAMFAHSLMERGVREASRFGMTGNAGPDGQRAAEIERIIRDAVRPTFDDSNLVIETLVFPSFGDVPTADAPAEADAAGAPGPGGPNAVVLYRARLDWDFWTPMIGRLASEDGVLTLEATNVVRNEPFLP